MKIILSVLIFISTFGFAQKSETASNTNSPSGNSTISTAPVTEKHLKNIRQLTFGGNNAEAYWSFDNKNLSFQSDNAKWGDRLNLLNLF